MKKTHLINSLLFMGLFVFAGCSTQGNLNEEELKNHANTSAEEKVDYDILEENSLETDIKKMYPSDTKKQKIATNFANELKKILIVNDFNNLDLNNFLKASDCMSFNMLGNDMGLIENLVFDTGEKMDKYVDFNEYQSGKFFGENNDIENLDCNF